MPERALSAARCPADHLADAHTERIVSRQPRHPTATTRRVKPLYTNAQITALLAKFARKRRYTRAHFEREIEAAAREFKEFAEWADAQPGNSRLLRRWMTCQGAITRARDALIDLLNDASLTMWLAAAVGRGGVGNAPISVLFPPHGAQPRFAPKGIHWRYVWLDERSPSRVELALFLFHYLSESMERAVPNIRAKSGIRRGKKPDPGKRALPVFVEDVTRLYRRMAVRPRAPTQTSEHEFKGELMDLLVEALRPVAPQFTTRAAIFAAYKKTQRPR
jgi:hypothetical protein